MNQLTGIYVAVRPDDDCKAVYIETLEMHVWRNRDNLKKKYPAGTERIVKVGTKMECESF